MVIQKRRMTISQFERAAPRLGPCELVRGEVIRLSPGGLPHSGASGKIAGLLFSWASRTKRGRILTNEAGFVTQERPGTVRGADVAYISFKRLPRGELPEGFGRVPPELVVEVVGRSQTWGPIVAKAGEYLAMGVDRVWVVDVATKSVHIYASDAAPTVAAGSAILRDAAVLPGFRCRVSEIFE